MRLSVLSALCVSLALIIGASWFKTDTVVKNPNLLSVEVPLSSNLESYEPTSVADLKATSEATNEEPLTTTDLVSRQLLIEYMNLAASGGASEEAINNLASKYAETVPTLGEQQKKNISEIKVVSNEQKSFLNYSEIMTDIIGSHSTKVESILLNGEGVEELGPELYSVAQSLSNIYRETSLKILSVPAPLSLSQIHLDLINTYLAISQATEYMTKTDEDPVMAFAGTVMFKDSASKEAPLLSEINRILNQYGAI